MRFRQDKTLGGGGTKYYLLVIFVLAVSYFSPAFVREKVFNALSLIGRPIWAVEKMMGEWKGSINSVLSLKATLEKENLRLKNENNGLKLLSLSSIVLQKENLELKKTLGRDDVPFVERGLLASILSGPVVPPYNNLILDAGADLGVSIGDKVIAPPNIILGEIIEVSRATSRAVLYSSYGGETEVIINAENPLRVLALGYGGGNFYIELQSDTIVKEGMIVSTPGMPGYVLGTVEFVKNDESRASQKILFKYPVNPSQIRFVKIIKK